MDLTNIENIIAGLESFNANDEVENIIESNTDVLVQLQRDQLSEGIDKDGNIRADAYAPYTISEKRRYGEGIGAITDHVTFYMTGSLYESLFYKATGTNFEITSPLPTYEKMIDRITDEEYGLSPDKRLYFAEEKLLPLFSEVFTEKTGLIITKN